MKKLEIKEIKGTNYTLREKDKIYNINLEFYDIEEQLKSKDYIYISEKLLDRNYIEYDTYYRFGKLDSEYGREIREDKEEEIIILTIEDKNIYLKRIFG